MTQSQFRSRGTRHGLFFVAAATVCLTLAAAAALNRLRPNVQGLNTPTGRGVAWYFSGGQFGADARTLVSAVQFLMDLPPRTLPPALPPTAPPSQIALDTLAPSALLVATNAGTNVPTA